jgi:periplasmic protein TonB
MVRRPPFLTLLVSLIVHVAAVGLLFLVVSDERVASALVIDLSELESAAEQPGPKHARAAAARPAGRASTARSAPSPSPAPPRRAPAPVEPTTSVIAASPPSNPEPTPPKERDIVPVKPEPRPTEPAVRSAEPMVEAPSASSAPPVAASPEQTSHASGTGAAPGPSPAPPGTTGGSTAGTGPAVALAPVGPSGGTGGSEYGSYYRQIRQRIQETLEYPAAARRRGIKGTVLLELLIKPDGAISAVVKVSSSHRLLDDAALETVRNLPRQPFPAGLVPRQLTVPLPVVFDLK